MTKERKSNRLFDYNYSNQGYYFITIIVDKKENIFSHIQNGISILNNFGLEVEHHLKKIISNNSCVKIDSYIIMPDHVHLIIGINNNLKHKKSLSSIIGSFKSCSSKKIRRNGQPSFKWHRSFYDHIIRTETELYFMREYIAKNPLKAEEKKIIT